MKSTLLFISLAALLTFPIKGVAETHQRQSWYIGFGLGAGIDARYVTNGVETTFDEGFDYWGYEKTPKVAANFKAGATLSPKTLLGFDFTTVRQEGTLNSSSGKSEASLQINNYFLMLTHFPNEEGFFIRIGGGLSNFIGKISASGTTETGRANGYGALGGLGYAFWVGKSFNLTLNLDHSRQFYSGKEGVPENSQFTTFYVGFDWY